MKPLLLSQKLFFGFAPVGIIDTAIHRANGSTLGLFMKTGAFGTFIAHNVVEFIRNRHLFFSTRNHRPIGELHPVEFSPSPPCPFHTPLIDSGIGAFGFACTAIDALVGYHYCHLSCTIMFLWRNKNNTRMFNPETNKSKQRPEWPCAFFVCQKTTWILKYPPGHAGTGKVRLCARPLPKPPLQSAICFFLCLLPMATDSRRPYPPCPACTASPKTISSAKSKPV